MDYIEETGMTAGKIFREIDLKEGKTETLSALKKKVNEKTFDYGLGWLFRENKVTLQKEGKTLIVKLL